MNELAGLLSPNVPPARRVKQPTPRVDFALLENVAAGMGLTADRALFACGFGSSTGSGWRSAGSAPEHALWALRGMAALNTATDPNAVTFTCPDAATRERVRAMVAGAGFAGVR